MDRILVYNEINFNSSVKAQKFLETFYGFVHVPEDHRAHMIVDIKAIKFRKGKPAEISDYAWTIYPIFVTLDPVNESEDLEIYVQSGSFMMPLLQGKVNPEVIAELRNHHYSWKFIQDQSRTKFESVTFMKNSGVLVRCVDNQKEAHFKTQLDIKKINYSYCTNKSNFQYKDDQKGKKVEMLLPKSLSKEDAQDEINSLVTAVYGVKV